jgi:hypothetical protein
MGSTSKGIPLLLLCLLVPSRFAAQQRVQGEPGPAAVKAARRASRSLPENLSQASLLNTSEGLSVIGAALESRGRGRSKLDCSHLVHTVYQRAGFPYSYVSSSDLYAGVDEFQPVTRPQAGDLVVWPGHVGIVVNPSQNTFFSALRSGIGVESYSGSYWRERGVPRFYRYAKAIAANRGDSEAASPGVTHAVLDDSVNTQAMSTVDVNPAGIQFPRVQIIDSARPQAREVTQAILLALSVNPEGFEESDVFKLARPLIVFSRLEVRAVKVHGDQGQIQVRITAPLRLARGQAKLTKRQETQTWSLRRRDQKSWELLIPQDAVYLSRDTAVRILAHQLALLADTGSPSANPHQKSQLAQMLNSLLME